MNIQYDFTTTNEWMLFEISTFEKKKKMDCFKDILNCVHGCAWHCCYSTAETKIDRKLFWRKLQHIKDSESKFHSTKTFIFEKMIHLNKDAENSSMLTIGLDPENEFKIAGRLEIKKCSTPLVMNFKQLRNFLNFLKDHQRNILLTLPVTNEYHKYGLLLHQTQASIFEICMHTNSLNIDEESLKIMCRMRLHIQRLISSLEMQSEKCETQFFKLLSHFYYGKTIQKSCDLAEDDYYKQGFFEDLISYHCDCIDKQIIIEFALHFEQWFAQCIPYFIDCLMLYESQRLRTFSSKEWTHCRKMISVEKLAKCGLFFIGITDKVQCAFCGLVLHKWEHNDNPILDHYKYKPKCIFLTRNKSCLNISDVGKPHEVEKLLSILNAEEMGYDEVDK